MSQSAPREQPRNPQHTGANPLSAGGLYLAVVLLVLQGVMTVLEAVAALAKDDVYVHFGIYAYKFSLTGWGWIHLVLGILLLASGCALALGRSWARIVAIIVACLHIIANFMFLPYQPQWSITLIALSAFVLWALCMNPRQAR
jgi:hypothetical protein